jgi:alkylation response protein AidB-like acyl-CoA dehydrogenase
MDFSPLELEGEDALIREEVRRVLAEKVTGEVRAEVERTGSSWDESLYLTLGERGWILPERPPEEGGAGLSPLQAEILQLELDRADAPLMPLGLTRLTSPAVERFGRPDLAEELIPRIARGEIRICLGYTEPDGGSDVAAAKTRAVRDGEDWVVNGSKMFTTEAQHCQYAFLLTRTNPDVPKHKGLTMFLMPLDSDGVEIGPIHTVGGERTNVVYFTDARVSDRFRLGEVDDGWRVLMGPLAAEHGEGHMPEVTPVTGMGKIPVAALENALDSAVRWAADDGGGAPRFADPVVRWRLAEVAIKAEGAAACKDPMGRVYGSLACIEGCAELLDVVGPEAVIKAHNEGAIQDGAMEAAHRFAQGTAIYGGTVEVFKNMVAQHVLGLPRQLPAAR